MKCRQITSKFGSDLDFRSLGDRLNDSRHLLYSAADLEGLFAHGACTRLKAQHIEICIDHCYHPA